MHNIFLLATLNFVLHRKNKKKRQDIENKVLNAVQEPLIRNIFNGENNEQVTKETNSLRKDSLIS
jgi:hypothetical protein